MALTEEQRNHWRVIVAGCDYNLSSQDWEDLLTELDSHYTEAPSADEQKPDLRAICIADENAFMRVLADRIVGNSNPEEDSRLDVAYAIARHLNLNWPSAYESPITPPASEQKPIAWATTNEDGDYAMLFFDQQEARSYSGDDEPVGLAPVSSSAPQSDYKAQRDALLDFANHIATSPKLVGTGWQETAQMVVASVKGGA